LKHRFLDLIKIEFWDCQEAENDLQVLFEHLNRYFIDLKKVAFSVGQEVENVYKVTFTTEIVAFSTSSKTYFGWSGGRN